MSCRTSRPATFGKDGGWPRGCAPHVCNLTWLCASWRRGACSCVLLACAHHACAHSLVYETRRGRTCACSHVLGTTTRDASLTSSRQLRTAREALPLGQRAKRAPLTLADGAWRETLAGVTLVDQHEFACTSKVSSSSKGFANSCLIRFRRASLSLRCLLAQSSPTLELLASARARNGARIMRTRFGARARGKDDTARARA
jgi:hypothetical protein